MLIKLTRFAYLDHGVCGKLVYADPPCVSYTVENPWIDNKPFISCIPEGEYELRPFSGTQFKNVWQLMDVPGRTYILIHAGNTPNDVEGCIAIGTSCRLPGSVGVNKSVKARDRLFKYLADWQGPIRIEITSQRSLLRDCLDSDL